MSLGFDDLSQERCGQIWYGLTIEGFGDVNGPTIWCNFIPSWGSSVRYKDWLVLDEFPDDLGSEVPIHGGVEEQGSISFAIADGVGIPGDADYDYLTTRIGSDANEDLQLENDLLVGGSSADLIGNEDKIAEVDVDTMLFIGGEALVVASVDATPSIHQKTVTVNRSQLDTEKTDHHAEDSVYFTLPFVKGRKVRLFLAYEDADSSGEEREVGSGWTVDKNPKQSHGLQAYTFSATSLSFIDRTLFRDSWRGKISRIDVDGAGDIRQLWITPLEGTMALADAMHFDGTVWMQVGDEIFQVTMPAVVTDYWTVHTDRRRQCSTPLADIKEGGEAKVVLAAETAYGTGSFRVQLPGTTETSSRYTGTWTNVDHPIPLALAALTSSAGDDGLEVSNFIAGKGNYSALPKGTGMGIPAAQIDFDSALEIWYQHPEWALPNLVINKAESGRAWLNREILAPFGIVIARRRGLITFFDARTASVADAGDEWGVDSWLLEQNPENPDKYIWLLEKEPDDELEASAVKFVAKNTDGVESEIVFDDESFAALFGHVQANYQSDREPLTIPVPGARFDGAGVNDIFEKRAFSLLLNFRRAPDRVSGSTDLSLINTDLFDIVFVSHPELVDVPQKRRGWTSVPCVIVKKEIDIENGKIDWELISLYHAGKIGLVAPAAVIEGITDNGDGTFTIDTAANRFTDANVPTSLNLPDTDAEAFRIGDRVRLRQFDGQPIASAPANQTVLLIIGTQIILDGDFGGDLAADLILVFATYDNETADQQRIFVSYADAARERLGVDADPPFTFGDS